MLGSMYLLYETASCYTSDMRVIWFLLMISSGAVMMRYNFMIVRTFGHMDWAEKYLGVAGSYTAWKLIGFVLICASFKMLASGTLLP